MLAGLMSRWINADGVGLGQRAASLLQNFDHAALGLRPVPLDQVLQVDPFEVFHRVVKNPLGRAAVIVDGDGIGVVQPAGQFHFALEAGQGLLVASSRH